MTEALTEQQAQLVAVLITFLFLVVSASLCRLYTRAFITKHFVTEDWLALSLLVMSSPNLPILLEYSVLAGSPTVALRYHPERPFFSFTKANE